MAGNHDGGNLAKSCPKILFLDLETSPIVGLSWRYYQTDLIQVVTDSRIIAVGYAWNDDRRVVTSVSRYERDLVVLLRRLLDEADIVVAHNGNKFDIPMANARMLAHGLRPPSPYKVVDTRQLARNYFRFTSNRLNELARYLNINKRKLASPTINDIQNVCLGYPGAMQKMAEYNKRDVELLIKVYDKLKGWGRQPLLDAYKGLYKCPSCYSNHVQKRGVAVLEKRLKQRLQCQSCGRWFNGRYVQRKDK